MERQLLRLSHREGRVTLLQAAAAVGRSKNEVEAALESLVSQGLLSAGGFHNIRFYEIGLPTAAGVSQDRFPSGPSIPLVYHFNLLSDCRRTDAFRRAIAACVRQGDTVIDLGCGTGVLAMFAADAGATVIAVEADPMVAEAAEYFVRSNGYASRVRVVEADSRQLEDGIDADVIICEMLDTALIAELQVEVMNDAVKKWLKPDGHTIPQAAVTTAELVHADYKFSGMDFRLIHFEEYGARQSGPALSDAVEFHRVRFDQDNDVSIDTTIDMVPSRPCAVNGVRLCTSVALTDDIVAHGSPWFNPPLVLPFDDLEVKPSERVRLGLSYGLGAGFSSVRYSVSKQSQARARRGKRSK
ncbi:50S ribosomal protein L11 methyltransferase [candidate division WOR-3 bacterium]|nr:50S ribosomal protein L11 methyltransferase [candidate division WOR-3 bacterium]